jgi:hypothetical protein
MDLAEQRRGQLRCRVLHGRMGEVRQPDVYPLSQLLLICQQFLQVGQLQAVAPGHECKVVHQVKLLIAEHGRPARSSMKAGAS